MSIIKIKQSAIPLKIPDTSDLVLGELAINTFDGKLFTKKDDGVESIIELGQPGVDGGIGPQGVQGPQGPQGSSGNSSPANQQLFSNYGTYTAVQSIDVSTIGVHSGIAPATLSLTFTGWATSGTYCECLFIIYNGGSSTITWPTIRWVLTDGTTTTNFATTSITLQTSGPDFILLWTYDGGTTVYGKVIR